MSEKKKVNSSLKIFLTIVLLITISILGYILLKGDKVESLKTEEQRIKKIKENLVALIPDKYEVVEKNYEALSSESDSCIFLYEIYPKEYSDIEKEYLNKAFLIYCKDTNTAILDNQVGEVRYSNEEDRWLFVYGETITPQEEKQYGENLVTITELGGSHASSNYYIVRIDGSDELVILSVPSFHRIRCETYDENGVETMKKDCIEFITSMGMPADCSESVPDEVYENYYNDLLEILRDI